MQRMLLVVSILGLSLSATADGREQDKTPAAQFEALANEFNEASRAYYLTATADSDRSEAVARMEKLPQRLLELAEKYPKEPVALDALVETVASEMWLEHNTSHPGFGRDSPQAKAFAILLRDHLRSDRLGEALRRCQYGFRRECETLLREVLKMNPHREVKALASLRLGRFLKGRLQQLDVIEKRPELARRYENLFGKDYLEALRRQDRVVAEREIEAIFERAAREFGDVKVPYEDTVAEEVLAELHELHNLSVGKLVQEIDGEDQDGRRFKLSDYRGKVVLIYFWSEY